MKVTLIAAALFLWAGPVLAQGGTSINSSNCQPSIFLHEVPRTVVIVPAAPPAQTDHSERAAHRKRPGGTGVVSPLPSGGTHVSTSPGPTSGIGTIGTSGIGAMTSTGVGTMSRSGIGSISRSGVGSIGAAGLGAPSPSSQFFGQQTPPPAPRVSPNAVAPPLPIAPPLFFTTCR